MNVVFYPVMAAAFPCGGVHERHAEGMVARGLREQGEILCLLDHDRSQVVGSTKTGGLRLTLERVGLRAVDAPGVDTSNVPMSRWGWVAGVTR